MSENDILPYVEPIYRFCAARLANRYDAEDLAGEIICHVLEGMKHYEIRSLHAWVWRIARNRYARFIDRRNRSPEVLSGEELFEAEGDLMEVDEDAARDEYEAVFRCLHTLSREYRNLFVDYYIGELPVKTLAANYSLSEQTVKWRLNVGREKIRKRIGEDQMDKIYRRINWNSTGCNGSMDSDTYLHTQLARAICKAAYEEPLTVEEISLATGIPTLYIEDELPRLLYGDAVRKIGNRYAADFIIFSLENQRTLSGTFAPKVKAIADKLEAKLAAIAEDVKKIGFYGCDSGMARLGHIAVPYILRWRIRYLKNNVLNLPSGPFPQRQDGGYGWFIIRETEDERELVHDMNSGCCSYNGLHYFTITKYFSYRTYNPGMLWLHENNIVPRCMDGRIPSGMIGDEDAAGLLSQNLICKDGAGYRLNFPIFTKEQFADFTALLHVEDSELDELLTALVRVIHSGFAGFVPKRLESQINQWVSCYANDIFAYVTEELIGRGILRGQDGDKPMVDGVFFEEACQSV